jgi:acetylglutamate kinase
MTKNTTGQVKVIKIGGATIDHPDELSLFLKKFAEIDGPKILVHGGGQVASQIGERLGLKPEYVDGRRVTNQETLELVTMVYGGLINHKIVSQLNQLGCRAIGISGADDGCIQAHKRPVASHDFGFVGDIEQVHFPLFQNLLDAGLTPVVCPLSYSKKSGLLNTNGDTIAAQLAIASAEHWPTSLIFATEAGGVLDSGTPSNQLISKLPYKLFKALVDSEVIAGGMLPKLDNAYTSLRHGVIEVFICKPDSIQTPSAGTTIQLDSQGSCHAN